MSVPRTTYRPSVASASAQVALWPELAASWVTEPLGRVSVMFVHDAAWFAVSVIVAAARTVEPSSGEAETSAGACEVTTPPPPPPLGGARSASGSRRRG